MKKLSKFIDISLYIIVAITLIAAISSAIWNRPFILTSVRSNSMYPLFERSDMLLIKPIAKNDSIKTGDIIVFKVAEGNLSSKGWIVHRIISGDEKDGFITKGDANDYTDQESGGTGPIQKEWIASKVLTIGSKPLKIPLIGYLPLWMEKFQKNSYTMPVIAVILAAIIGISEITSDKKKRRKKKNGLELQLIYVFGGLTISVIMGATMLATSQRITVPYEVSKDTQGILMGSDLGIIVQGETINKSVSELNNKGIFPIISTITTKDEQITFSHPLTILKTGDKIDAEMTLTATNVGKYNSTIYVSMFYPFLPGKIIYYLASQSYWLALIMISLIPGLPLMLFPMIEGGMRRKTIKEIRRRFRRILNRFPVFN